MQAHPLQEAHHLEETQPSEYIFRDYLAALELDFLEVLAAIAFSQVQLEPSVAHTVL